MQKEIKDLTDILDDKGEVAQSGWARDEFFNYDRTKIKSSKLRIKEWDFWEIFNDEYEVVLNIFDIGMFGVADFSFADFKTGEKHHAMLLKLLTRGSIGNPKSWRYEKPLLFQKGKSKMQFSREGNNIILEIDFPKAMKGKGIEGKITLHRPSEMDTMANLIPFKNPRHFVYAQKMNCLTPDGEIRIGEKSYKFTGENNSNGVLDWTRAVFPYSNHWKWCSASGKVNGDSFGFNLDYGFGTESSKNMIFFNGKGHHLDEISYQHDWKDLNKPLQITSNDNRVNLVLHPTVPEKSGVNLGLIMMKGIKTYGYFTGSVILDNGDKVEIKVSDKLFGWAEEFYQRW